MPFMSPIFAANAGRLSILPSPLAQHTGKQRFLKVSSGWERSLRSSSNLQKRRFCLGNRGRLIEKSIPPHRAKQISGALGLGTTRLAGAGPTPYAPSPPTTQHVRWRILSDARVMEEEHSRRKLLRRKRRTRESSKDSSIPGRRSRKSRRS